MKRGAPQVLYSMVCATAPAPLLHRWWRRSAVPSHSHRALAPAGAGAPIPQTDPTPNL